MGEEMDGALAASRDAGTRRRTLVELTDEELLDLATGAKARDEEVQELVCAVYWSVLEERDRIRDYLRSLILMTPLLLLPGLLEFVAREAQLADL